MTSEVLFQTPKVRKFKQEVSRGNIESLRERQKEILRVGVATRWGHYITVLSCKDGLLWILKWNWTKAEVVFIETGHFLVL